LDYHLLNSCDEKKNSEKQTDVEIIKELKIKNKELNNELNNELNVKNVIIESKLSEQMPTTTNL